MFLEKDEYIILMNLPKELRYPVKGVPVLDDELRRLKDIGIKTVLNIFMWPIVEMAGWSRVDALVEQTRRLGMKNVLTVPHNYPSSMPIDYCARAPGGIPLRNCLSIWNPDAVQYQLRLLEECVERYGGDDVLIVHAGSQGGEAVLYPGPCFYDPWAIKSYREYVGDARAIPDIATEQTQEWLHKTCVDFYVQIDGYLVQQHNSIWNALQWLIGHWTTSTGNGCQEQLYAKYAALWPGAEKILLQYTHFCHHETEHPGLLRRWMKLYNMQPIVEAMFLPGLPTTAPLAIGEGFRGQVLGALHEWGGVERLNEDHYDIIASAQALWRSAKRH